MNIRRWESLNGIEDLFHQYSPLFARAQREENVWTPAADISETDKEYLIKTDLPAVKKEDVKITLANDVITISGERKQEKEHKDENEIRVESFYGTFTRSFSLPNDVDTKAIRAETKDGVLRVHIPKTASQTPKTIAIDVK